MKLLKRIIHRAPKKTARLAKERLQIIVSHERKERNGPDFLPLLQKELIEVIAKYVDIDRDSVKVELERDGNCSVLELNVPIPEVIRENGKERTIELSCCCRSKLIEAEETEEA